MFQPLPFHATQHFRSSRCREYRKRSERVNTHSITTTARLRIVSCAFHVALCFELCSCAAILDRVVAEALLRVFHAGDSVGCSGACIDAGLDCEGRIVVELMTGEETAAAEGLNIQLRERELERRGEEHTRMVQPSNLELPSR